MSALRIIGNSGTTVYSFILHEIISTKVNCKVKSSFYAHKQLVVPEVQGSAYDYELSHEQTKLRTSFYNNLMSLDQIEHIA